MFSMKHAHKHTVGETINLSIYQGLTVHFFFSFFKRTAPGHYTMQAHVDPVTFFEKLLQRNGV